MNCVFVRFICLDRTHRSAFLRIFLGLIFIATTAAAQTAVNVPRQEEKDRARRKAAKEQEKQAQRASSIDFRGQAAFDDAYRHGSKRGFAEVAAEAVTYIETHSTTYDSGG